MCVCACLFEGVCVCVRVYMCDPNKPIACKAQDWDGQYWYSGLSHSLCSACFYHLCLIF